jgi:hypothetical protein
MVLRCSNMRKRMSALGQKRTFQQVRVMSALPPKADMVQHRFLIGGGKELWRTLRRRLGVTVRFWMVGVTTLYP